jgi:hypothetical protein
MWQCHDAGGNRMDSEKYIEGVLKTESKDMEAIRGRLADDQTIRMLHAAMGMATEAGELVDMMKKHIFYGRELDLVNAEEELGDGNWYQGVMVAAMRLKGYQTSFEQIMEKNIAKLRARYGDKFSEEAALERDLDTERDVLENY